MIKTRIVFAVVLGLIAIMAQGARSRPGEPQRLQGASHTSADHGDRAKDSIYVYGDPATLEGQFEDVNGQPDWQGWTTRDMTTSGQIHWNVSAYNCANLDVGTPGNQAWWCGRDFYHDCETGDYSGYGPLWNELIVWEGAVADPGAGVAVTVTADLNHDLELDWDNLYLEYWAGDHYEVHDTFNGEATVLGYSTTINLTVNDYIGSGLDVVRLAWRVRTDVGWDDLDCKDPSLGAAQIDNITVSFDQGGGPVLQDAEDNEGGSNSWTPEIGVGVGDFAQIRSDLADIDPCNDNFSCQVAFIDDGAVVPGTGGTVCFSHCYDPGGWTVNPNGGLLGPSAFLNNRIISPVLPWSPYLYPIGELSFDLYDHLPLGNGVGEASLVYYWVARSTLSEDPADITSSTWSTPYASYGSGQYLRRTFDLSRAIEPDAKYIQVALGVWDIEGDGVYSGTDATPAPYFDNIEIVAHQSSGPALTAAEYNLAQDNFPTIGGVDYGDLSQNSVAFDAALNISPPAHFRNDPGDSLTVTVGVTRAGAALTQLPRMYYQLNANPVFNAYRTSGLGNNGWVAAVATASPDVYAFDLPDVGFLFPGDVLHYYFHAVSDAGGDVLSATLPADLTGFGDFSELSPYPTVYTMRALPSVASATVDDHPPILLWNDFGSLGGEDEWRTALRNLDFTLGTDYDLYTTTAPGIGVGQGLGGRATVAHLFGYDTILYTSGNATDHTITDLNFADDPGDDVGLLDGWLYEGNRNLFLTGNNVASDLMSYPLGVAFVAGWLGVACPGNDVSTVIAGQFAPWVLPVGGNPVIYSTNGWRAVGSCPDVQYIDDVTPVVPAVRLALFTTPAGGVGPWVQSAATLNTNVTYNSRVISVPFDLMNFHDKTNTDLAERTKFLGDVLNFFFYPTGPGSQIPDDTISLAVTAAAVPVSLCVTPGGTGDGFGEGYSLGGGRVAATITLTVLDGALAPVPMFPAEDMWIQGTLGGLVHCAGGAIADANTDRFGVTRFSLPIRAGGFVDYDAGERLRVVIAGTALTQPPFADLRMNSPDINRDLSVGVGDYNVWGTDWGGGYHYRSDLYWDQKLDLADAILLVEGKETSCE